jgi:hypothetical protein
MQQIFNAGCTVEEYFEETKRFSFFKSTRPLPHLWNVLYNPTFDSWGR